MFRRPLVLPWTLLTILAALRSTAAQSDLDLPSLEQAALRAAAQAVAASVVQIETLGGLEKIEGVLVGTGPTTGLIVAADGYIVSSAFNFIQQPSSILVTLPGGRRQPATVVGRDESRMIVLLKVATDSPLPVPVAAPRQEMVVGQWTVAVGRAFQSEDVNVSIGILSALDRIWGKAIQTDAKISPNNYGGPLVDVQGRVLGVLVPLSPDAQNEVAGAEWYDSGIGFAVPLVDILQRLDALRSGQNLKPGILGISLKSPDLYSSTTEIGAVQFKSPAAEAGLKVGDTIVQINGAAIERPLHLKHALGPLYAGDTVHLVAMRDRTRVETQAVLTDELQPYECPFLGILPLPLPLPLPQPSSVQGVSVRFVYPDSGAAKAGLQPLDRITQFAGEPVADVEQLRQRLGSLQPQESIELGVHRGDSALTLTATLGSLPTELPPELPPIAADATAAEARPNETGAIDVRVAEQPNACTAYVPDSYDGRRAYGLLVSLDRPETKDASGAIAVWKDVCVRHDLILLLPRSQDPARWMPMEVDVVRRMVDQIVGRFRIDPARIVVHGREGGAAMAYLVAFTQRDLVRGVIAEDAPLPMGLRQPVNEPLQPLAILATVASGSPVQARVAAGLDRLRQQKFPVTVMDLGQQPRPLTADECLLVGRWIESLTRL